MLSGVNGNLLKDTKVEIYSFFSYFIGPKRKVNESNFDLEVITEEVFQKWMTSRCALVTLLRHNVTSLSAGVTLFRTSRISSPKRSSRLKLYPQGNPHSKYELVLKY